MAMSQSLSGMSGCTPRPSGVATATGAVATPGQFVEHEVVEDRFNFSVGQVVQDLCQQPTARNRPDGPEPCTDRREVDEVPMERIDHDGTQFGGWTVRQGQGHRRNAKHRELLHDHQIVVTQPTVSADTPLGSDGYSPAVRERDLEVAREVV
jgi:hypothetical protein